MQLFIFSGKQPSWYIIFVKLVRSVSPASLMQQAFRERCYLAMSFVHGIPVRANSTSLLVTGVNSLSVCTCIISPLLSS